MSVLAASLSFQVPSRSRTVWVLVKRIRNNGAGMRLRMQQVQGFNPAQRPLLCRERSWVWWRKDFPPSHGELGPGSRICGSARQDSAAQSQKDSATPLVPQFASNWSLPRRLHPEVSGAKLVHGQGVFWDIDVGAIRERQAPPQNRKASLLF